MSIRLSSKGDFSKVTGYLEKLKEGLYLGILNKYGREGVNALRAATPVDSGKTAAGWYYKIQNGHGKAEIQFCNSNINEGVPIAIIIQYGHGTGTGGWVQGVDYINPALKPVFEEIKNKVWEEVTKV